MDETKITFDRLNDFNWSTWRFRMELMLMREDLWTIVKNPKPEVEDITSAWIRKDEKARAMIGLALEDSQLSHIMGTVCAKEMWDVLKGYHERGSLTNKINALRKLCSLRLVEGASMSSHLVEVEELVHRLSRMGEALKEHLVVAIILSSLPESYNPLVTALEGRPEEDLKVEYIKGKLLDEWRRKCESENRNNVQEKAMKATTFLEYRRNVRVCHHCKEKGHVWRNCLVLQEEVRPKMKSKQDQVESMIVQHPEPGGSGTIGGVCFRTTTTTTGRALTRQKWILDTGCTKHMTGSEGSLVRKMLWNEKVTLADGRTVTTKGRGQGRIFGRGLDGKPVDMKLKELLYVPELSGNVLSVSRITDEGYTVVFSSTNCRILDGSTVIAVGAKSEGLYYLTEA